MRRFRSRLTHSLLVTSCVWGASACDLFYDTSQIELRADARIEDIGDAPTDADSGGGVSDGGVVDAGDTGDAHAEDTTFGDTADMPDVSNDAGSDANDVGDDADAAPPEPFTHQPAQHVVIAEHDFSFVPSDPAASSTLSGFWSLQPDYPQSNTQQGTETDAPFSPDSVMSVTMPAGLATGGPDWWIEAWGNDYLAYREAYLSLFVKLEGADFENDAGGIELAFFVAGSDDVGERRVSLVIAPEPSGPSDSFELRGVIEQRDPNQTIRVLPQNAGGGPLRTGTWHEIEMRVGINTPGNADGDFDVWVDDQPVLEYDDVEIQTPTHPGEVDYFVLRFEWLPSGADRDRMDRILVDHGRLSALP